MKNRYFRLARKIALTSHDKFRVGAVLVRGNAIVGMGCNDMGKSHPKMFEFSSGSHKPLIRVHAELTACRGFTSEDIDRRFSLYVYRTRKNSSQGMAKPCDACVLMLRELGISRIFFSLDDIGYGDLKLVNED